MSSQDEHVLLNRLVTNRISTFLPSSALRDLRLTCMTWNVEMSRVHQQRGEHLVKLYDVTTGGTSLPKLAEFTSDMMTSPVIPFSNYWLDLNVCPIGSQQYLEEYETRHNFCSFQHPAITNFFTVCGQVMTKLERSICLNQFDEDTHRAVVAQLAQLPVLAQLTLTLTTWNLSTEWLVAIKSKEAGGQSSPFKVTTSMPCLRKLDLTWYLELSMDVSAADLPDAWMEPILSFLAAAPNLEDLHLDGTHAFVLRMSRLLVGNPSWKSALRSLRSVRTEGQPGTTTLSNIFQASSDTLKLSELHLIIRDLDQTAHQLLSNVFSSQSSTLKLLAIKRCGATEPVILHIPLLPVLETLKVEGNNLNLEFSSHVLPALKQLIYHKGSGLGQDILNVIPLAAMPSVTTFNYADVRISSEVELTLLAFAFPSLKVLHLSLNFALLPHLWTQWSPLLEELHLQIDLPRVGGEGEQPSMDSVLTGIPDASFVGQNVAGDLSRLKTVAGLGDLQQLRILELRLWSCTSLATLASGHQPLDQRFCITDVTGYQVFAHAPRLLFLEIGSLFSAFPIGVTRLMSEDCKTAIRQALGPDSKLVFD